MSDVNHEAAVRWLSRVDEPLLVATPSLADADALLQRGLGGPATIRLVQAIVEGSIGLVHPTIADVRHAGSLMETAAEYQPRLVDALLVSIAQRLRIQRIGTFERRPLAVLSPRTGAQFDLEP
jgi:predicted nucleic acid-binding protein